MVPNAEDDCVVEALFASGCPNEPNTPDLLSLGLDSDEPPKDIPPKPLSVSDISAGGASVSLPIDVDGANDMGDGAAAAPNPKPVDPNFAWPWVANEPNPPDDGPVGCWPKGDVVGLTDGDGVDG